jgi:hypothetical protein
LPFWDAGGLSDAGVATRAVSSADFVVARAASADVETLGGVSTSIPFVLNAAAVSGARATAAGSLALAGSAVSAAVVKPVLVTSVAFDGQGKAGANPAARFDDQFAILGTAAALSVSSAVSAEHFEAAVASSSVLFTRANANGSIQAAASIRTAASVAARAESQILPGGSSVGGLASRLSASGVVTFSATGAGGVASTSTAAGTFVALTQSKADVPVDVLSARAIGLVGSGAGRVANAAGIAGSVDPSGSAVAVTNSDAAAQSMLGVQGHSDGAVASRSQSDGSFDAVNIGDTTVSVSGKSSLEIEISGSAAAQAAVDVDLEAAIALVGAARAFSMISANAQSQATVQTGAQVANGNAAIVQASLEITGVISGTSQAPLFAQAASGVLIGGFAKLDAAVSGASEVNRAADLFGTSDGNAEISGAGVSTVEIALNLVGANEVPARAASVAAFGGDASAIVVQAVAAADVFSVAGTSEVGLPVNASVRGEFTFQGDTAGFSAVTVSAQGEITVTRTLVTDVSIFADAARAVDLNGQGAAIVVSGVTSAIASITVSGTITAAALALGDAATTLGLSGKIAAEASPASDVSGAFEVGLTASGNAPRQAVFGAVLVVGGTSVAVTDVASAAFGDLASSGNAYATVLLHAKSNLAIVFTRDAAAVALIDATSARAIAFGLNAVGQVDLAAGSVGQAPFHLASGAALTTRAETADALDLAGVASAQGDVKALGAPSIDVAGASISLAVVGSDSFGEFTIASAGEADATVIGNSARSLPLIGYTAATVQLTADAVGGTFDVGLIVAAVGDARADASGAISLTGIGRCNITARAQADSVFAVTRSGAGDVSVGGQSARVVTFLGQASVSTASAAAANTPLQIATSVAAQTALRADIERVAVNPSGESAGMTIVAGSASTAFWPVAGASIAFRAPPSARRRAYASTDQGGRLLPSRRSAAA